LTAAAALAAPAGAAAASGVPTFTDGNGIHVVEVKQLDPRQYNVKVATTALRQPVDIRILVPNGYASSPRRRYPVLYLFHGTSGGASDWVVKGKAKETTAPYDLITVMPDAGYNFDGGGWFTDWWNEGRGGVPKWETFHIKQVISFIDRTLRTIASRRGRAIYGLSQGGFGSMTYASRHPDMFTAAGAFSGAVETTADPEAQLLVTPIVAGTAFGLDGEQGDGMFGSRATQQINWAAHDPGTLAENLQAMDIRLLTGNGGPGVYDPTPNPAAGLIEGGVSELNALFHAQLVRHGIPHLYRPYGGGTHIWAYWTRDLQEVVPPLMAEFAHPHPRPAKVRYRSAENSWSAWGWNVVTHRPAREFGALREADIRGFVLSGSGSATVTTPAYYRPRSFATVRISTTKADQTLRVRANRAGRLVLDVPLGHGNPYQQYTAAGYTAGTHVYRTTVRISSFRRR
jgi:S-formylglutathione hydrolase FrmB